MSDPKFYWLVAGQVVTNNSQDLLKERTLNVVVTTDQPEFARREIAKAQEGLMRRFIDVAKQIPGRKIVDCVILAANPLGLMTAETFNAGFEQSAETPAAVQ